MKLIPLTQGQTAMVDDRDYEWLSQWKWYAVPCRRRGRVVWYAVRSIPNPRRGRHRQVRLHMHTVITGYGITDHVDGDGLNNQRSNLRETTARKNRLNSLAVGGSSNYKGVSWNKDTRKWKANIGTTVFVGYFANEEDAARAFDRAARVHHGAWGTYNFPRPGERSALTGELVAA